MPILHSSHQWLYADRKLVPAKSSETPPPDSNCGAQALDAQVHEGGQLHRRTLYTLLYMFVWVYVCICVYSEPKSNRDIHGFWEERSAAAPRTL